MNYQLQRQSASGEWVHFISSDFIENLLFTFVRYRNSQFNFFYDNWRIVRNSDDVVIAQKYMKV